MVRPDRRDLGFSGQVRELFGFLRDLGFHESEALPTIVRFKKDDIEVDIYHGRLSYEIGASVTVAGGRYSMSEIVQASDPDEFRQFRYAMATTPEGVEQALKELASSLQRFGGAALSGDAAFLDAIAEQHARWAERYALEVLADQLRPKAREAFRKKDYATAADLYSRIRASLSAAEQQKLDFAIKRSDSAS